MGPATLRYLTRADVEAVGLTGLEVVDILDAAFRAKGAGRAEMPTKIGVHPRPDASPPSSRAAAPRSGDVH
jgi:ornithine cyclodeaminase/alanine dehydrogenase